MRTRKAEIQERIEKNIRLENEISSIQKVFDAQGYVYYYRGVIYKTYGAAVMAAQAYCG